MLLVCSLLIFKICTEILTIYVTNQFIEITALKKFTITFLSYERRHCKKITPALALQSLP